MTLRLLLLLLLVWQPLAMAQGEAGIYLRAEPFEQEVAMNTLGRRLLLGGAMAADLSWGAANTFLYFSVTGEPFSTALVGAYNVAAGIPYVNAHGRVMESTIAVLQKRKEVKEIARLPGARQVRALTTGYYDQNGVYTSTLHSKSFLFLESELPPGEGWMALENIDSTKVRLTLQMPGRETPQAVEISLRQLFDGYSLDLATAEQWREGFKSWNRSRSLWERWVSGKGSDGLFIQAELLKDGKVIPLGQLTSAKGVVKFLGLTPFERAKGLARAAAGAETKIASLGTINTQVIRSGGCSRWYRRLLGKEVKVEDPKVIEELLP